MQNLHPVMQQALAPFAPPTALTEYHAALSRFDWGFELSDDARRVERTRDALIELLKMQREVDKDGSIWMSYLPHGCFTAPRPVLISEEEAL